MVKLSVFLKSIVKLEAIGNLNRWQNLPQSNKEDQSLARSLERLDKVLKLLWYNCVNGLKGCHYDFEEFSTM